MANVVKAYRLHDGARYARYEGGVYRQYRGGETIQLSPDEYERLKHSVDPAMGGEVVVNVKLDSSPMVGALKEAERLLEERTVQASRKVFRTTEDRDSDGDEGSA